MVTSFFTAVTDLVAAHPYLAYGVVLLLAMSESLPVIGAFIPGTAAILAVSALVPSGIVKLWPLLSAATIGAIIGDGFSFWLGHHYYREILERWPLNRHRDLVARSEEFFARHGDKSIFIARFTPGVRAFVPMVAGILRVPVYRFYAANILSAFVWAPSHIVPAVFVGAAFGALGTAAKPLAILVVLIIAIGWAGVRLARTVLRCAPVLASDLSERLQRRMATQPSRWNRFALDLLDPSRSDARSLAFIAVLLIGSAWLFFGILENVVSGDPLVRADVAIFQTLRDLRTVPGDAVMLAVTELGDTVVVVAVTVIVFVWLAWKRAWRPAAYWLAAIGGAAALNTIIKVALHRARPTELFYTGWSAFSFPSGHSTVNLALYGGLAFLVARELRPAWRFPVVLVALSWALLIAFSRIYLGAHWFSDAVGGLAFGMAWLATLGVFYQRKPAPSVGGAGLLLVACAAVVLTGGFNIHRHHALDVRRYAVQRPSPTLVDTDWWASGWEQLPSYRVDLTGEIEEPLTVQWAGDLPGIRKDLQGRGWRPPAAWSLSHALGWLATATAPVELPVVPRLSSGRLPSLTLVLPNAAAPHDSRFVFRLWATDVELSNGKVKPIWVGSVVEERVERPLSLFSIARTESDANAPRDLLARNLPTGRLANRSGVEPNAQWDGEVLLLQKTH